MPPQVDLVQLGCIPFGEALARQIAIHKTVAQKVKQGKTCHGTLLVAEHPPTLTLGRTEEGGNILAPPAHLTALGIESFAIRRGGKVTFHGPGQAVLYPILPLKRLGLTVKGLIHGLETVMTATCADYGVQTEDSAKSNRPIGAWIGERKIGQIGVFISRGISRHGLAFNVNVDLKYFELINPCGLQEFTVTTLEKEVARTNQPRPVILAAVQERLVAHFGKVFGVKPTAVLE